MVLNTEKTDVFKAICIILGVLFIFYQTECFIFAHFCVLDLLDFLKRIMKNFQAFVQHFFFHYKMTHLKHFWLVFI